jgi:AcrR family transcriptional regulator
MFLLAIVSYEGTIVVDGVEYRQRLPRGRHGIPQDLVIANQRERLLDAATRIFAEQGYSALSVAGVIEEAGVSRQTFYDQFENKISCVLAAQARAFDHLQDAIDAACEDEPEWPGGVAASIPAVVQFAVDFPAETCLILASSNPSSEPELVKKGLSVNEWLAGLLREGSKNHPDARSPSEITEQAAIGAVVSIVGSCLTDGRVGPLRDLKSALVRIILAPYLGGEEAMKIAETAR